MTTTDNNFSILLFSVRGQGRLSNGCGARTGIVFLPVFYQYFAPPEQARSNQQPVTSNQQQVFSPQSSVTKHTNCPCLKPQTTTPSLSLPHSRGKWQRVRNVGGNADGGNNKQRTTNNYPFHLPSPFQGEVAARKECGWQCRWG